MIDWDVAVRDIGPRLLRYFCASFPRPQAADLVQDTLLRLYQKAAAGGFDPRRGSLRMYAFGIAHYVRLEALKQIRPREPLEDGAGVDGRESLERLALRAAIARLKEEERRVILLLIDRDLGLAEIGRILGIPEGTVKSHVHRAKASLQRILNGDKEHGRA